MTNAPGCVFGGRHDHSDGALVKAVLGLYGPVRGIVIDWLGGASTAVVSRRLGLSWNAIDGILQCDAGTDKMNAEWSLRFCDKAFMLDLYTLEVCAYLPSNVAEMRRWPIALLVPVSCFLGSLALRTRIHIP